MTAFDTAWDLLKIDSPDYQGHHKAPIETDYHVPIFNLNTVMPDIYSHPEYYNVHPEHMELLNRVKNDPSQELSVYRSVPKGVQTEMNAGDWVTPFREYAEDHGERFDGGYDIIEELVAAHDLLNEGNSVQEYGWLGHRNRLDPDVAKWIRSHMMEEDE